MIAVLERVWAKQASDDRLMLVTYLIIFAVVALVVIWWWQQTGSDNPDTVAQLPQPEITSVSEAAKLEEPREQNVSDERGTASAPATSSQDVEQQSQDNLLQEPAQDLTDDSGTETVENNPIQAEQAQAALTTQLPAADAEQSQAESADTPATAAPVELVFEFSGDCWMNLVDATGEAIAYGVKASGRVMPVSGVPPFEVTLGAPEVVQISYAGEAIDMSQFSAGRTARFTLPLSQ